MPSIEVCIPFTLRLCRECKVRHFPKGVHEVSRQELDHWFTQGCIAEGRAVVVPVAAQAMEIVGPGAAVNHDEFAEAMNLTIGVDLGKDGSEAAHIVEYADGIIQGMEQIPAAKATAKTTAKPKGKGK